ncbi:MAG: Di-/tripeptide transporter [Gemmatimonadaceae bacterium]|nr:Di-/tripeptide transporter [Gemmatimonadaceae bacterium]
MTASAASLAPSENPVFDDKALLGQPRGLGLLFLTEMWERFSYYGMRALLVLYLVNELQWSDADATRLYGTYTGLVWLTPIFGGYLADRFIGTRRSLVLGACVIAAGHFVLALQSMSTFYLGLALVIIGTGFFKPNVSTMVGQIYRAGDHRRDAGFTVFYMGINTGAFIAPFICGTLGQRVGWHYGFGAAGVGMLIGLLGYLWGRDRYLPGIGVEPTQPRRSVAPVEGPGAPVNAMHGVIGGAVGLVLGWFGSGGNWFGILMGVTVGAALGLSVLGTHGEERKRVIALFIVVFFVIFFWMAYEQAGSSMNIFADRYTDLQVGSFAIPSSWFQSASPLFVLLLSLPVAGLWRMLDRRGKEPSTPMKMVWGLAILGGSFALMYLAGRSADACIAQVGAEQARSQCHVASPLFLVMTYAGNVMGELFISPIGLSYVTKVAPARFGSLLMGAFFLSNSAASKIGGYVAGLTDRIPSQATFWSIFIVTSLGAAIAMLLLVPTLKRLTSSVKA